MTTATVTLIGYANSSNSHVKFALCMKQWVNSVNHSARCQYTHTNREREGVGEALQTDSVKFSYKTGIVPLRLPTWNTRGHL